MLRYCLAKVFNLLELMHRGIVVYVIVTGAENGIFSSHILGNLPKCRAKD